jgi:hypothetical protein
MVGEGYNSANAKWGCYGALTSDPINGPWTSLNSGNALNGLPVAGDWDYGGFYDANPKLLQRSDGSYVLQFNGSDNSNSAIADWQHGYATSATRSARYTKASFKPTVGRVTGSYVFES